MAKFGAKYPCFKPASAGSGSVLGKLVSANLTVNLASGSLAMETDDMTDAVAGVVYGATVSNGVVTYKSTDTAPYGVLAYYKVLMRSGVKSYQGYCYPKAKAALGNDNAQTKGSSITFQTTQTTFTIMADDSTNTWRETKSFSSESDAIAWVKSKVSIT